MEPVTELFPTTGAIHPLRGLYLAQNIRGERAQEPFVYTNFISSLDGRIATPGPDGRLRVPPAIVNRRDWRLFHELAAQADVLLTSGRYLRDYVAGKSQDIFAPYDDPELADLEAWRLSRRLPALPAIAVLSASLDFRVPGLLLAQQRPVLIFTGATHDTGKAAALRRQGLEVQVAGDGARVEGKAVVEALGHRGYRQLYSVTGPEVMHTLLVAGRLHRLYLTQAPVLLGGGLPSTLLRGDPLVPPARFRLHSLYLDQPTAGPEQQLACFDICTAFASEAEANQ